MLNITNLLRATIKDYDNMSNDILYSQNLLIIANNINSAKSATILLKATDKFELTGW